MRNLAATPLSKGTFDLSTGITESTRGIISFCLSILSSCDSRSDICSVNFSAYSLSISNILKVLL